MINAKLFTYFTPKNENILFWNNSYILKFLKMMKKYEIYDIFVKYEKSHFFNKTNGFWFSEMSFSLKKWIILFKKTKYHKILTEKGYFLK